MVHTIRHQFWFLNTDVKIVTVSPMDILLSFPVHWDTGKDVTVNDLMFLFNLENENADDISHGFDMNTENKQLEEVAGTDDETSIKDLHHFAMLVNNTMDAIPFNTETEMELSILLGKVASELELDQTGKHVQQGLPSTCWENTQEANLACWLCKDSHGGIGLCG
ncbi:hypothetical protein DM01DRAFT_1398170 [Hesseltinella vesiculosa]|uniref:Uncharacterized protein n=1 Tax=Hesseltinella vesiculosa TaxID=101127 RepID=A0A1X2G5D5_9FUNG|nr:hypothetical protein DM01DRAFT_1398170 [Hesseltinella vesiculosa]